MKNFVLILLVWIVPSIALAQRAPSFAANHFDPYPNLENNLLSVAGSGVLSHLELSAGMVGHYASEPVVLQQTSALIEYQAIGEVWFGFGLFDHVDLGLMFPVTFAQEGGDLEPAADDEDSTLATVGDMRVTVKAQFIKPAWAAGFGAAMLATAYLPTGDETTFNGEGAVRFEPRLALDWTHPVGVGVYANIGYQVRPERTQLGYTSDDKIRYGVGLTSPSGADNLRFYAILFGDLDTVGDGPQFGEGPGESAEALGGIQWTTKQGVTLNLGAGPGLTDAVGSPKFRVVVGLGFSPPDADKDRDGILDRRDVCPLEPEDKDGDRDQDGCPDDDRDADQITDGNDACPEAREDYDGFDDADGCPDPDNDSDGVKDEDDRCPLVDGKGTDDGCPNGDADGDGLKDDRDRCPEVPEDKDGFDDTDGCPDDDNDFDGVPDANDRCPFKAEDKDGFRDTDGCPDEDNDGDGITDVVDQCSDQAETFNAVDDGDGCPDVGRSSVQVSNGRLVTEKVYFANNLDHIDSRSYQVLNDIARMLKDNPQIARISIEGHTDSRGNAWKNKALSERRANAVRRYLIDKGISPHRLTAKGFGADRPIADNDTTQGREQNRRVEFILE